MKKYVAPLPSLFNERLHLDLEGLRILAERVSRLAMNRVDLVICDSIVGEQFSLELGECLDIAEYLSRLNVGKVYLSITFNRLNDLVSMTRRKKVIDAIAYIVEIDEHILENAYSFTLIVKSILHRLLPSNTTCIQIKGPIKRRFIEALRESIRLIPEFNTIIIDCNSNTIETVLRVLRILVDVKRDFKILCYGDMGLLLTQLPGLHGVIAPAITIAPEIFTRDQDLSSKAHKLMLFNRIYDYSKSVPGILKLALNIIDDRFKPYVRPPLSTEPTYLREYVESVLRTLGVELKDAKG